MKVWYGAAVLSILLAGCSGEEVAETGREPAGRPVVYASNYPLQYFAQKISAPLVDVRLPVPAGEDPAFWEPTPEDVAALQKADLVVLNGASYESWLKNVSLASSRLVDTSEGFKEQFIAQETTTHSHGPMENTSIRRPPSRRGWTWPWPSSRRERSRMRSPNGGLNTRASSRHSSRNWRRNWKLWTRRSARPRRPRPVCRYCFHIRSTSISSVAIKSMAAASTGNRTKCRRNRCGRS